MALGVASLTAAVVVLPATTALSVQVQRWNTSMGSSPHTFATLHAGEAC
jgi:hypothetical protein